MTSFESFIHNHAVWFRGPQPVPKREVRAAEKELGVQFPETLCWLLASYGHWRCTGVASLPVVIAKTKMLRPALPHNWIVIAGNRNWSPVDPETGPVWHEDLTILQTDSDSAFDGAGVLRCSSEGKILRRFSSFSAYVRFQLSSQLKWASPWYERCPIESTPELEPLRINQSHWDSQEMARRLWETMIVHHAVSNGRKDLIESIQQIETILPNVEEPAVSEESQFEESMDEAIIKVVEHSKENSGLNGQAQIADEHEARAQNNHADAARQEEILEAGRLVQMRRQALIQAHVDVGVMFQRSSSSPRGEVAFPENVPFGQLEVFPLDELNGDQQHEPRLFDPTKVVTILEQTSGVGPRYWIATWGEQSKDAGWKQSEPVMIRRSAGGSFSNLNRQMADPLGRFVNGDKTSP